MNKKKLSTPLPLKRVNSIELDEANGSEKHGNDFESAFPGMPEFSEECEVDHESKQKEEFDQVILFSFNYYYFHKCYSSHHQNRIFFVYFN